MLSVGMSIVVVGLFTNGCALWQPMPTALPTSETPVAIAKPLPAVLSESAAATLEKARLQVADAKRTRSLWKSAAEKLGAAEVAATNQDSANTLRLSNEIIALCEQSRAQLRHPPVVW
jgi:hypothetical protein